DIFTYEICDDGVPVLCDTATVVLIVEPVTDITEHTIENDSTLILCANDLTNYNEPATAISLCNGPSNGDVTILGECATYTPDMDFIGFDTVCLYSCDPNDPMLCDTTLVIIEVIPPNTAPVANNDLVATSVNTDVDIDVLANDFD